MIRTMEFSFETGGHTDVRDITGELSAAVAESGLDRGQVLAFVPGSTAGITTVEFEPGLVRDLKEFFEDLLPEAAEYHHHQTWGDDNGASHVRAALIGPSIQIPFDDGKLLVGTWQQVVLIDFDTRPRRRRLIVQVSGESSSP
jgi:secondary thiamine-phosphate synthase enzyme